MLTAEEIDASGGGGPRGTLRERCRAESLPWVPTARIVRHRARPRGRLGRLRPVRSAAHYPDGLASLRDYGVAGRVTVDLFEFDRTVATIFGTVTRATNRSGRGPAAIHMLRSGVGP